MVNCTVSELLMYLIGLLPPEGIESVWPGLRLCLKFFFLGYIIILDAWPLCAYGEKNYWTDDLVFRPGIIIMWLI